MSHVTAVAELSTPTCTTQPVARQCGDQNLLRYQAVQSLEADGKGIKTIMRELRLAKETVRRFYRAEGVEERGVVQ